MRKDIDNKREEIEKLLKSGVPRLEICRLLKCKYDTLRNRLEKWNLQNYKNQGRKGFQNIGKRIHVSKYLGTNKFIRSEQLRKKLIYDGLKKEQCENCKNTEWMNKKIPLELDHINGNHWDNRLENLRIICPNCHAQTPTNSGKNIGAYTPNGERLCLERSVDENPFASSNLVAPTKNCLDCGKKVNKKGTRCKKCAGIFYGKTKIQWPDLETLKSMVIKSSYLATGRFLGVSDNAVRKHIFKREKSLVLEVGL